MNELKVGMIGRRDIGLMLAAMTGMAGAFEAERPHPRPLKRWSWDIPQKPLGRGEWHKLRGKRRKQKKRARKNRRGY